MRSSEKSVLIITPYFAPQSHAAVFRAHKLAKYLPELGWKTHVLTVDTNYLYNEDPGLLEELPADVTIHRARYIEPTMRGVRMALGGDDRTFRARKSQPAEQPQVHPHLQAQARAGQELRSRVYSHVLRRWLSFPDRHWTWYRPAVSIGRRIVEQHRIGLVYSSSLPHTSHRIAMELQRMGPKWVADFRDPVTYGYKWGSRFDRNRIRQGELVREMLAAADAVTVLSSSYSLIFNDLFGPVTRRAITFIPTGVDDQFVPDGVLTVGDREAAHPYIIFVGEIMPESTSEFFGVFGKALRRAATPVRLRVVGNELLNRTRLAQVLDRFDLVDQVDFVDHMPQRDLYRELAGATAAVLAPGPLSHWWNNHAKLVDYVGLRKPVLAVVPDPSEARSVLTRARLGVFLDGDEAHAVTTLVDFLNGDTRLPEPNAEECDRYLASRQVQSFAGMFDSLLEP